MFVTHQHIENMKKIFTLFIAGVMLSSCNNTESTVESLAETSKEAAAIPVIDSKTTEKVIQHHLAAFGSGDMDALLSDYTEESVVLTPDTTLIGLDQIKALFANMGSMFPAEGSEFVLDRMDINNELGYIIWHANTPIVKIPLGTDTYIVKDGKIIKQTFAAKVEPK